mmetsp:Transcript_69016/g.189536  ORF Transcript_69016/g.189536 Transcript_69016/m.189536 type:complete len:264 (-) Transcript_69016:16-807(-)
MRRRPLQARHRRGSLGSALEVLNVLDKPRKLAEPQLRRAGRVVALQDGARVSRVGLDAELLQRRLELLRVDRPAVVLVERRERPLDLGRDRRRADARRGARRLLRRRRRRLLLHVALDLGGELAELDEVQRRRARLVVALQDGLRLRAGRLDAELLERQLQLARVDRAAAVAVKLGERALDIRRDALRLLPPLDRLHEIVELHDVERISGRVLLHHGGGLVEVVGADAERHERRLQLSHIDRPRVVLVEPAEDGLCAAPAGRR